MGPIVLNVRAPRRRCGTASETKRFVWIAALCTAELVLIAGASRAARPAAVADGVGRRFPSERSVYRDQATGVQVVRLTSSPAEDVKIYQTHPSWTSDGEWIVFHSNRTGQAQLFAVHEQRGTIVQLTDEPGINTGQICLSRRGQRLLTVIGRSIVKIDLEPLLAANGLATAPVRSVVGTLADGAPPAGAAVVEIAGTMSWDAAERELYLGLGYPQERRWSIASLDIESGDFRSVIDLEFRVGHVQANPWRSGLIMYCHETGGDAAQRMWVVRSDGSGNRPFYLETYGEWVTHEVWWDQTRSLFTVWPKDEAMRKKPHGLVSAALGSEVAFHARFPYWHVSATADCSDAVADTFAGNIFLVDLNTGERVLLTEQHRRRRRGVHAHPTLHPTGTRALFNSNAAGNADLCLVDLVAARAQRQRRVRTRRYTRCDGQHAQHWQRELRSDLRRLLKTDDLVGTAIPLRPNPIGASEQKHYTLRELEINATPGRRVPVLVSVPNDVRGPRAAVVCIHGHGGSRRSVHDPTSLYKGFAAALAGRGVVTIAVDVGQHRVYEEDRTLMGERLWDLQRCVDYLETRADVDRARIGCAGLSLGGEMAMWLGALDERIVATVSSGFLTTMDQMEMNHCTCWKFDGLRALVDYADIYALIAPRALQCQNGSREPVTDFWVPLARQAMREIEPIYQDLGRGGNVELAVHDGGHEIDLPSLIAFFDKHLHLPTSP